MHDTLLSKLWCTTKIMVAIVATCNLWASLRNVNLAEDHPSSEMGAFGFYIKIDRNGTQSPYETGIYFVQHCTPCYMG